jgi:hypothetical protein
MTRITREQRETYERLANQEHRSKADERLLEYLKREIQQAEEVTGEISKSWLLELITRWPLVNKLLDILGIEDAPSLAKWLVVTLIVFCALVVAFDTLTGAITGGWDLLLRQPLLLHPPPPLHPPLLQCRLLHPSQYLPVCPHRHQS